MSKSVLGIEIGAGRLKAAQMKDGSLESFHTFDLPDDMVQGDALVAFDAMAEFLKNEVRKSCKAKNAALVLPDSAVYIRRLNLPAMTAGQLKVNLPYEFRDVITEEKEKFLYDYAVIELKKDEEGKVIEMDLMAAAVSKDVLDQYDRMFHLAGMKLVKAAPAEMALGALIKEIAPDSVNGDFAVLDLGWNGTRVNIYRHGIYEVTRSIDTGIASVVNAVADTVNCDPHIAAGYLPDNKDHVLESDACKAVYSNIAVEVTRAINYYTYENRDNTLEDLYFCGGGAWIEPLIAELTSNVPLKLVPLARLSNEYEDDTALTDGPAAVGITLE